MRSSEKGWKKFDEPSLRIYIQIVSRKRFFSRLKLNVVLKVRSVAPLYKLFGKRNDIAVTFPGRTLEDLIDALIGKYGSGVKKAIMGGNGEIDMELRVVVNQFDHLPYGERMERVLEEGDMIRIMGVG